MATNGHEELDPVAGAWWAAGWEQPLAKRRKRLWEESGHRCHWCKRETRLVIEQCPDQATVDHVLPRYKGGNNQPSNLVSACYGCNARRNAEDMQGLKEGSLLGKFLAYAHGKSTRYQTVLTGDEKRQLLTGIEAKKVKADAESVLREQRDQALKEIAILRKERVHYEAAIRTLETQMKTMTVMNLIRMRLAEWLRPKG